MNPQEKAKELFKQYLNVGMGDGWAKQCALIAVNELIRIAPWGGDEYIEIENGSKEFYVKVKQEIEKNI